MGREEYALPHLAVVIPTLDAAPHLAGCLRALREARGSSPPEIAVVDGGSSDDTPEIARDLGARVLRAPRGRGIQLAAGAEAATTADWLLFLHADTVLAPGWSTQAMRFLSDPNNAERAAYFRFTLDDRRPAARRLEAMVAWRCRRLGLPFGDQGLLIARSFYERLGGFRPLALMEDVDLVRRIGRTRLTGLPVAARTSAARFRREGYVLRPLRNLTCLSGYYLGLPPSLIRRLYG